MSDDVDVCCRSV